jgi:hypothetical protein
LTFYSIYLVDRETPFSQEEKDYIFELVDEYIKCLPHDQKIQIPWKEFQLKMKEKFGNLRSRNSIKNLWNSNKRRNERNERVAKGNEVNPIEDEIDEIEIESRDEIKVESRIEYKDEIKNEIENVAKEVHKRASPVNEIGPCTKSEKYTFKFLLNNDDKNDYMDVDN